jgi:hypothetical protein
MPSLVKEMFSDAENAAERGDRLEALKEALSASIDRHDRKVDGFVRAPRGDAAGGYTGPIGVVKGGGGSLRANAERIEMLAERFGSVSKSMSTDEQNAVTAALAELRDMAGDISKDITSVSPGNLHPYDLEAPSKQLVPRFTPLRNDIPRGKGIGTAREYRRILGYTNTGMGGVPDASPFFNSESDTGAPIFGQLALRRGQKIEYAMDVHTLAYMEMSLSDMVTWKAQFANLGFESSRALSQMGLLWAHMLGEEKAMLYSRGASASGYEGAVAAPVIGVTTATTGGAISTGQTLYAKVTAKAGGGESLPSSEQSVAMGAGNFNTFTITVSTEPAGALSYNLYVSNATGTEKFQTSFVGNSYTLTTNPTTTGAVVPAADSTANANGYDGFLSVLADPNQAGVVSRVNAPLYVLGGSNNLGDKPFQDSFASLFASVYADPEELWLAAPQRRELVDWVRSDTTGAAAYRITLEEGSTGITVGGMVSGIVNESSPTSRIVDIRVHPYMPAGAGFIRSRHLDIPNSGIGDTTEVIAVQDYMSVDWPQVQFTYDSSTYWFGSLCHYAPKWSAGLFGMQ